MSECPDVSMRTTVKPETTPKSDVSSPENSPKSGSPKKKAKLSFQCGLCTVAAQSRKDLQKHIISVHDVSISTKQLTFDNETSFLTWKTNLEKETCARFVKQRGPCQRNKNKRKINHYNCHREGVFSPRGTGKRRIKQLGSNKIGASCPARIKAITDLVSGSVEVELVETHVGHDNELGRLHLTKDERRNIAAKLAAGMKPKEILKEIKESPENINDPFINSLTYKDIWNIQQEFKLNNKAVRHSSDSVSAQSGVAENEVVRFYEQQGILLAHDSALSRGCEAEGCEDQPDENLSRSSPVCYVVIDNHHDNTIQDIIVKELSRKPAHSNSFECMKARSLEKFQAIIDFAQSEDELAIIESTIHPLISTIEAARSCGGIHNKEEDQQPESTHTPLKIRRKK